MLWVVGMGVALLAGGMPETGLGRAGLGVAAGVAVCAHDPPPAPPGYHYDKCIEVSPGEWYARYLCDTEGPPILLPCSDHSAS